MTPIPVSFYDMLPPEALQLLGISSAVVAVLGLLLWATGIRIARPGAAVVVGAVSAGVAACLLPAALHLSLVTCAIVGLVAGLVIGAFGFRYLQAAALALCLAVCVGGAYYRWHVPKGAAISASAVAASLPVSSLMVKVDDFAASPPVHGTSAAGAARDVLGGMHFGDVLAAAEGRWAAVPAGLQLRILIATLATGLIGLVFAIVFPKPTTVIGTAVLGAVLLFGGIAGLVRVYAPESLHLVPHAVGPALATLGVLAVVGMVLQMWLFWPFGRRAGRFPSAVAVGV